MTLNGQIIKEDLIIVEKTARLKQEGNANFIYKNGSTRNKVLKEQ